MGINIFEIYDFRIERFLLLFILSLLALIYISRNKSKIDKVALLVGTSLIFIYSGVGASFSIVPVVYLIYYVIYLLIFLCAFSIIAFKDFVPNKLRSRYELILHKNIFSNKNSNIIIYSFLLLSLIKSFYPDYNMLKLFLIKKPELIFDVSTIEQRDLIQNILFYVLLLLQPFYFIALANYKKKPLKLFLALEMPIYFAYASGGYVARSTLVPYLVIFLTVIYLYNKKYRKFITLGALVLIIPLLVLLYNFSIWRSGGTVLNITTQDKILTIISEEIQYPIYFNTLVNANYSFKTINFIKWLITLPFPKYLKDPSFSIYVNYEFSEIISDQSRLGQHFSVILPGVVTESFYIFGKYFFFIMPLITGCIMGFLYKIINSSVHCVVLKIYFILMLFSLLARAGGAATLAIVINSFLLFYFIMLWIRLLLIKNSLVAVRTSLTYLPSSNRINKLSDEKK